MFHLPTLLTYMGACLVIILIPGPAQALVLSNTISYGKKSGIMTVLGLNISTIFHSIVAGLGLSAVLATSAIAFSIVKFIGAAYLIYLGIVTIIKSEEPNSISQKEKDKLKTLTEALVTGILNPKVALFFLAFLPQFVNVKSGFVILQFIVLGLILGILDIIYESILVFIASTAGKWFVTNQRFTVLRKRIKGTVLIGLGLRLAFLKQE